MRNWKNSVRRGWRQLKSNPKLILRYFLGNFRYFLYKYLPFLLTKDFKEQIELRKQLANPECLYQGLCIKCGCKIPNLLFTNESCHNNCYPPIMDKKSWHRYKLKQVLKDINK